MAFEHFLHLRPAGFLLFRIHILVTVIGGGVDDYGKLQKLKEQQGSKTMGSA
jgi:hypothetical protein